MKSIGNRLAFFLIILFLGSCAVSNDVISENKFQKRKYQKGFHIHKLGKKKNDVSFQVEGELSKRDALVSGNTIFSPEEIDLKNPKEVKETKSEKQVKQMLPWWDHLIQN